MSNYTPGPWAWEDEEDGWLNAGKDSVLEYAGCGSHGCSVSKEDARLIAAAPDLLEALQSALETAEFEKHPFRPWHEAARAAIAKATQ